MSYAYWASNVVGNTNGSNGAVNLGEWYDGIPIYTIDEFIEMITTDNNTQDYVLAKDLDFNNITPASWIDTSTTRFNGSFDGLGHSLSNISLTTHRGIFGVLEGATVKNLVLNNIDIQFTSTVGLLSSGILVGRMQGNNNLIENITINNSVSVNTNVLTGGLIGLLQPLVAPGVGDPIDSSIIRNIEINNATLSGGFANQTYGNGGIIGTINNHNVEIENVYVNATITSPNAHNSGGIIGATLNTSNVIITNAEVVNSTIEVLGSNTTLGSGGIIGKTTPTGTLTMTNASVIDSTITLNTSAASGGSGGIVGFLQGTNHDFNQLVVNNSSISSGTSTGGVIGLLEQASGVASFTDVSIEDAVVSTTLASQVLGVGGVIGTNSNVNTTLEDIYFRGTVTATNALNAGGVIGATQNTANITLTNALIDNATIQVLGSNTTLGSGGIIGKTTTTGTALITNATISNSTVSMDTTSSAGGVGGMVGYLQGTNHEFSLIRVLNSNINSRTSTGGVVGLQTQTSGVATYNNIKVKDSTITATVASNALGSGGVVGHTISYNATYNDIYVESTVQASNTNVGGVIGYAQSGTNTVNRAVIFSTLQITNTTSTDRGTAAIIGRNAGTSTANHTFFSGYLRAHSVTNRPYAGILRAIGTNLTFTNSRSAEIRYWASGTNTNQLVNEANNTLYNRLRGQKATFSINVYRESRGSLNTNYWLTNYSTFDYDGDPLNTTSLWFYNASNVLELRG